MANISGRGGSVLHGGTSEVTGSSDTIPLYKLGTRATDESGNEYLYVDFQEAFLATEWCVIGASFAASQLQSTSKGPVGIVCGTASASDRWGWVQIYGAADGLATTDVTTGASRLVVSATTDQGHVDSSTSAGGLIVHGAFCQSLGTTATTPATALTSSFQVCGFWLNYPYVNGIAESVSSGEST